MKYFGRIGMSVLACASMVAVLGEPASADLDRGIVRINNFGGALTVEYVASPTQEVRRPLSIRAEVHSREMTFDIESRFVEVGGACFVSHRRPSGQGYEVTCMPPYRVDVLLGERRDRFELRAHTAIHVGVVSAGGDDSVKVRAMAPFVSASIDTGDGDDDVLFDVRGDVGGQATISGGAGRDHIHHDGTGPVNTGPGDDVLDVRNGVANAVDCVDGDRRVRGDLDLDTVTNCTAPLLR